MILGWSPHQTGTGHGEPIRYLMSPEVEKQINGVTQVVKRDPIPELLCGEPKLFMATQKRLRIQNRYRVATMTFTRDDICPDRFNAGDAASRAAVASCIEAFTELSFAGVPPQNRLPIVVGTHTHTGRLEINFALARAVVNAHGRVLSFNPHPPQKGSANDFDYLTDMLNHHFGWNDPRDPERMRRLKTAGWIEKRAAETLRNGEYPTPEEDPVIYLWLTLSALSHEMDDRSDLLAALERELPELDMRIAGVTKKSITIVGPTEKQKICLRGSLVDGTAACCLSAIENRVEYLKGAKDRVAASSANRAAQNSQRFSKGHWSEPAPDFARILTRPNIMLPTRHPAKLIAPGRIKLPINGVFRSLLERLSRLKSDIMDRVMQAMLVTPLTTSLTEPLKSLNSELEKMNDRYARTHRSPTQPRSHPGDDSGVDPAAEGSSGRQRHRPDVGADQRADHGTEPDCGHDRQAAPDPRTDIDPSAAPVANRVVVGPAAQPADRTRRKIALWHAARRAVIEVFPDTVASCYLIVPDDPEAIAIQTPDWRVIISEHAVTCTRGELSRPLLEDLCDAIGVKLAAQGLQLSLFDPNRPHTSLDDDAPTL